MTKEEQYRAVIKSINAILEGEDDAIAMMATISCELKHAFDSFSWAGFYRVVKPGLLKVGPYQGSHGCLEISFDRGVCGRCASERTTQIVADVSAIPYHIACSGETKSEIVVPVFDRQNNLIAVLDIDSNLQNNFDEIDRTNLERICGLFKI
ncbi:MAG TPA: GAF domain-containing protein [Bacteroidota bacterium]|nr:GAF domain-containing protein [Bacteroidota bacterium]